MKRAGRRSHYLLAKKRYVRLTDAEIEDLVSQAQSGEPGAIDARKRLVASFIPLVISIAVGMPFHGDYHLFDELVSVGSETLLMVVSAFDVSLSVKFYTYLRRSLEKEMHAYLFYRGGYSRPYALWIPYNMRRRVAKVAREWKKTGLTGDLPLSFIMDYLHVTSRTAEFVLGGWKASLREREEIVSEFDIDFVDRSADAVDSREAIAFALQVLDERESDLIRKRWLTPGVPPSLRQLDRENGLTYGMSLYFEQKAFTKMREALCA